MNITPAEIKSKQFKNSFRGFDSLEVRDFLDFVADEMTRLIDEYDRLKNKIQKKDELLAQYQKEQDYLKKTLLSAQQMADDLVAKAQSEADEIREQAQQDKKQIIAEAEAELKKTQEHMNQFNKLKDEFIKKLRKTVQDGERLIDMWNELNTREQQES